MSRRDRSPTFLERGGAWVLGQSVLMFLVIVLGVVFPREWTNAPLIVTGAALFGLAAWFGIAGVMVLGRNRTPYPRPRERSELIEHGIYARVRHPLYTSVILACIAWALIWQSASALLPALAVAPFLWAKARVEERWLREQFPAYEEYASRVPRFVPRLRRSRMPRS